MVFAKEIEAAGTFEADFTLFDSVLKPGEPAYFLYRTAEADSSTFILYTYGQSRPFPPHDDRITKPLPSQRQTVPDTAPVRSKMIYASTRSTLIRSLGQQRISTTIFATTPDDLTAAAFARHERHLASAAPMTEREKEQEAMKLAENSTRDGESNGGRSMVFGKSDAKGVAVGLAWSDAALEATKEFVGGEKAALYFEIDIKLEQIILAEAQPASLALPTNSPSYLLYRHDSRIGQSPFSPSRNSVLIQLFCSLHLFLSRHLAHQITTAIFQLRQRYHRTSQDTRRRRR